MEKPMDELQGTALQYSCVTAASRGTLRKGEKRVCIFCDKTYAGGPSVIADHIMHPSGSKIAACGPKLEWLQRFNEVSAEMKRRKGPTPTGPTPGEQRTGALNATRAGQTAMDKFLKKPTIEEIEEQFMRVACKHNGAMALADCGEFRKLLAMCARAGHSVLEGVKVENPQLSVETRGQTYVITLCHRTKMTTKVLPALDQKLMDKIGPIVERSAERRRTGRDASRRCPRRACRRSGRGRSRACASEAPTSQVGYWPLPVCLQIRPPRGIARTTARCAPRAHPTNGDNKN